MCWRGRLAFDLPELPIALVILVPGELTGTYTRSIHLLCRVKHRRDDRGLGSAVSKVAECQSEWMPDE